MSVIFFCGALCSAASLQGYVDAAATRGLDTRVLLLDTNPLSADHGRDLEIYRAAVDAEIERSRAAGRSEDVSFFAYSGGAKFATRIAQDTQVKGLFLLDPVDGPPPGSQPSARFPVYLGEIDASWRRAGSQNASLPPAGLRIVRTEKGEQKGFTGTACVTPAYGPRLFAERLGATSTEQLTLEQVGHLDVLFKGPGLLGVVCPRGSAAAKEAQRARALEAWEGFLDR